MALHQHNEHEGSVSVVERLRLGQRVAYVSDAGTPGISDPGARLAAACHQQGLRVIPLPGASSVTALLSVAGVVSGQPEASGFVFAGFLPSKTAERSLAVASWAAEPRAVVLLEAPHRIESAALALAQLGRRRITVGRELTKQFEEIATLDAADFPAWLQADANRLRGEFALAIHPADVALAPTQDLRVLKLLLAELPLKTAVRLAAEITGESKNALYDAALALKNSNGD